MTKEEAGATIGLTVGALVEATKAVAQYLSEASDDNEALEVLKLTLELQRKLRAHLKKVYG